jgi:hypothetical protein
MRRAEPRTKNLSHHYVRSIKNASARCHDCWLERYLVFLQALNAETGRGPVATHCVSAAERAYSLYCSSCDSFFRFSAWRAISAACQILSQREGRN